MNGKWRRLFSVLCIVFLLGSGNAVNIVFAQPLDEATMTQSEDSSQMQSDSEDTVVQKSEGAAIEDESGKAQPEDLQDGEMPADDVDNVENMPQDTVQSSDDNYAGDMQEAPAEKNDADEMDQGDLRTIQPQAEAQQGTLSYASYVQNEGWQTWMREGQISGTTGERKPLEAFRIQLSDFPYEGGIEYRAYMQKNGWMNWKAAGADAGLPGQNLRLEAIQIKLTGEIAEYYDIYYRAHSASVGWLDWTMNGGSAGTAGLAKAMEAFEIRLVPKGGAAPGSTDQAYITDTWQVDFVQNKNTTTVNIVPEMLDQIIEQNSATTVALTATMNYNGKITRQITAEKNVQDISAAGFGVDFGDFGKFTARVEFRKNGKAVAVREQTIGVVADEYNIAPVSATFPVVMFSLSLWDINVNDAGETIPTIVMLGRPSAYNWNNLPENVYSLPYFTKQQAAGAADYTAFQKYVKDLYELNPNAKFNLYLNDIDCSYIQSIIYANQIPEGHYTITLMSDGSGTYSIFNDTYNVDNPSAKHQELVDFWNEAKQNSYKNGTSGPDWGWHAHWECMYAVVTSEPGTNWWVARDNLFATGDETFTAQVKSAVTVKNITNMLTALQNKGESTVQEFKALYDFNDGYFSEAEAQGKKAMMLMGTYVTNEANFEDYANLTKLYYGDDYLYYYKGHPNTPTGLYPQKAEQLEKLDITDVDSSIAAELILFFNPDISLSGYGTSTFNSASEEMACGLFNMTKAAAFAVDGVDYSGIDWFASSINKENVDAAIKELCPDNSVCYLLEFSDAILADGEYNIAIYNANLDSLTFYKQVGGQYEKVKSITGGSKITYRTHVAKDGWQSYVKDGKTAGTEGQKKAVEALEVQLGNTAYEGQVEYQAHVEKLGWMPWQQDGQTAGTTGKKLQMEAVRLNLSGEVAEHYDIYYRVHVETYGWLDWAKNGETAGTTGYKKRLEAIEIKLVEKGEEAPGSTETPYRHPCVEYASHVQTAGWQNFVLDGAVSGTTGERKRLEAIKIIKKDTETAGDILYRSHVQSYGWENGWKKNGQISGTAGQSKRLEAVQIQLTGELAEKYDIYYRVHSETYGWLGWAKNGESAGTEGLAKRMEGLQVQLVKKGGSAPGSTENAFIKA